MKIEQGKRNAVSRLFHAKNDKDAIATWKSDLSRVLHIFNVRSAGFMWPLLTVRSQTELAINTHIAVSNTQTLVSELQHDFTNALAIVSDIHTIVKGQEGADGQSLSVSTTCTLFAAG
jgi:hypothetical protein